MRFKIIASFLIIVYIYIINVTNFILVLIIICFHIYLRCSVDAVGVEAHDEAVGVAGSVFRWVLLQKQFLESFDHLQDLFNGLNINTGRWEAGRFGPKFRYNFIVDITHIVRIVLQ